MANRPELTRGIRLRKTEFTSLVSPDHPVYQGVMDAKAALGDTFPRHVRIIEIVPDLEVRADGRRVLGRCYKDRPTSSRIVIFAGSITQHRSDPPSIRNVARHVILHEIGHSHVASRIHSGLIDPKALTPTDYESLANEYANGVLGRWHTQQAEVHWGDF